jgi:mRNA interferase MazF
MRRGEIRWFTFKAPDKRRPVVILTRDTILEYLGEVTVAPVTTTIRHIPTEVVLTEEDGMPQMCCVNLDHIQTVSKHHIGGHITTLNEEQLLRIKEALLFALGF